MALTDRILANLRSQLPGAVDGMIQQELWGAINEFCREAWAWRETLEIALTANVVSYELPDAATINAELVAVLSVAHPVWSTRDVVIDFGTLVFKEGPTAGNINDTPVMFVVVALAPKLADQIDFEQLIPQDMWVEHYQAFFEGTLARLMSHVSKPYSNPQMAVFHMKNYRGKMFTARQKARTGGLPGTQFWSFPRHTR